MHTVVKEFSYEGKFSVVFYPEGDQRIEVKAFNDFDAACKFCHYLNGGQANLPA